MSSKKPYNILGKISAEFDRFNYTRKYAQEQARKKMWWDDVCRQICPDIFRIFKDHLEIDDFRVECLIVGKNEGTTEGIPAETAYDFQKKLMNTTLKGCIIQISEKLVPIPTSEAQALLSEAIYYNHGNQLNYIKDNDLAIPDENLRLDHEDMKAQVKILHDNKENMFHAAYIITIWAEDDIAMKVAKSHIKGVMRENRILGELPIRRMFETFMTGQPGPDMEEYTTIEMYSGLASIISPTINPMSPLAGTGKGVYFGNEVNTGKDVALDFFSEAAPHAIMVGATGSGKTYALILLMIRLYLEGRKVMYLTKKRDDHTNYRAIAEYFAPDGGIIEIGAGKHNINPLQIIYDSSMEHISKEQATGIYDGHKEIFCAFMRTYCADEYSVNQDSYVDQSLNELYISKGIIRDDPRTWRDPSKFPVMAELRAKWEADYDNLRGHRKGTCEVLINKTYKFSRGGSYDYVNRPTDADFGLRFAVIDIVKVPSGLREAMNVMVTGILASQVSAATSRGLTIVIDEGGAFLREPQLADMILTGLTQWRSQNTQLIFATQQFGDLEQAKMSEAFMSNTFFKMVFGANMDESVVPYVQKFLHLRPQHVEELKRLKKGQCLLKIRNKYVSVEVTASDDEHTIIKGIKANIASSEVFNTTQEKQYKLKPQYEVLSKVHKIMLENWFDGEYNEAALRIDGYTMFQPQRITGSGTTKSWIHNSIIKGNKVEQQTPDHYNTVVQMGAYIGDKGFYDVRINHWSDVDVSGTFNGETYAFEFERDGTHTSSYIFEKFSNARKKYDHVYIVCVSANKSKVIKAVEPDGKLAYGATPKNMCTRGTQFEDLINDIVAGKKRTNAYVLKQVQEDDEDLSDYVEPVDQVNVDEDELEEVKPVVTESVPMGKVSTIDSIKNKLNIFKKKEKEEVKMVDKDGFFFKPVKTEIEKREEDYKIRKASDEEMYMVCPDGTEAEEAVIASILEDDDDEEEVDSSVFDIEEDDEDEEADTIPRVIIEDDLLIGVRKTEPVVEKKLEAVRKLPFLEEDELFINGEEGPMKDNWWEL